MCLYPACRVCGDDIVLASLEQYKAEICPDCDAKPTTSTLAGQAVAAPQANPVVETEPPRATECNTAESQPSHGGDRAAIPVAAFPLDVRRVAEENDVVIDWPVPFAARVVELQILEVEQWVYLFPQVLAATPRDLHFEAMRVLQTGPDAPRRTAYVVVRKWRPDSEADPLYDVGPRFTPHTSARESHQAALRAATMFADAEAKRLSISGPFGYELAREF